MEIKALRSWLSRARKVVRSFIDRCGESADTHNAIQSEKFQFTRVYQDELALPKIGIEKGQDRENIDLVELQEKSLNKGILGVAFSGGGIRSATFNLGVIQALCELKLLRRVSYLSTVSGGGYIGGWLTALIHRKYSDFFVEQIELSQNKKEEENKKEKEEEKTYAKVLQELEDNLDRIGENNQTLIKNCRNSLGVESFSGLLSLLKTLFKQTREQAIRNTQAGLLRNQEELRNRKLELFEEKSNFSQSEQYFLCINLEKFVEENQQLLV